MLQTYRCWNCCGLSKESIYYECPCPNCGALMSLPSWSLRDMLFNSGNAAQFSFDESIEFVSVGNLLSDESGLVSYAVSKEYLEMANERHNIVAVFAKPDDLREINLRDGLTAIMSANPQLDFFLFHNYLVEHTEFYGTLTNADNVHIDERAMIHQSAAVSNAIVEASAIISPSVVVGVDGARLIRRSDGTFFRALHGGNVHIGEGAYIGANSVIVRSLWRKPTTIGAGAFIGNLVNVGHNVQVDAGAVVLTGAVLGGRSHITSTGRVNLGAIIRPGVIVAGTVQMGAVVTQDVPEGAVVSGNFAIDHDLQIAHTKLLAAGIDVI